MAKELPYVLVPGKIADLFKKISDAKVPDSFSHAFLRDTLGLKSNNDRPLITLLKALNIIDASGTPTARYRELKNNAQKGKAVAAGIREAYKSIFEANERANELQGDALKGLIAQVAGTDKELTNRIFSTFNYLVAEAEFTNLDVPEDGASEEVDAVEADISKDLRRMDKLVGSSRGAMNSEFHFNIQIHLPNNASEETYLNIFNALRESLQ